MDILISPIKLLFFLVFIDFGLPRPFLHNTNVVPVFTYKSPNQSTKLNWFHSLRHKFHSWQVNHMNYCSALCLSTWKKEFSGSNSGKYKLELPMRSCTCKQKNEALRKQGEEQRVGIVRAWWHLHISIQALSWSFKLFSQTFFHFFCQHDFVHFIHF